MDFLYHLSSRIDVGLFCGLGLSQFFFFKLNLVQIFFGLFFLLESRTNNFFLKYFYLRLFLIFLKGKQIKILLLYKFFFSHPKLNVVPPLHLRVQVTIRSP